MKKNILLLVFVLTLSFCLDSFAHPPSLIKLNYNKAKNECKLIINHHITTKGHFIASIEVYMQGTEEALYNKIFPFQINKRIVNFTFPLPEHEKEDVLIIKIKCNRTGEVTREFPIEKLINGN